MPTPLAQLPSSCADQFGEPEGQCPMSLSWSGTIKITVPCGVVTFSEGDAPAVGTVIKRGDTVSTGAKSRVEITLPDGGVYRVGPSSKMQCDGQIDHHRRRPQHLRRASTCCSATCGRASPSALGGDHEFEQQEPTIAVGVRGSAFTASVQRNGDIVYHVIQGTGFIRVKGKREFDYPAGTGVRFDPDYGGYTRRPRGRPPTRRSSPPRSGRPSSRRVRLVGARAGKRPDAALHAQRERHRHRPDSARPRTACSSARPRRAAAPARSCSVRCTRGRYTLMLFATVDARSIAVQKSFRVT